MAEEQEGTASEERARTASEEEEAHHQELVEDLVDFDREVTEDMNTKKFHRKPQWRSSMMMPNYLIHSFSTSYIIYLPISVCLNIQ